MWVIWVIVTLSGLAVFTILMLCVPLDIALHMDAHGRPRFRMRLSWFFGLVSKEVTKGKKKPEEREKVVEGKAKLRERSRRARAVFQILRTKGLPRQLTRLLRDTLRCLKIGGLRVDFRMGLDDPADTGLLFAFIGPAIPFLSASFPHEIRVQPSFGDEAVFEGHSYGVVRLRPIKLVPPFMRFAFSLATIRAAKILVLTKWKRKK
ncbi:MAG: DUF2953 domain-containing protein [Dehalococcoidia bacterium]|nr:DUF2953 domain-containing protein [Dehalococcoidia bacterium]